jgi:hypothetical protein
MPQQRREKDEETAKVSELERSIDPPRNFTITTEERIRAMATGAPAWAVRKRRLEDALQRYANTLRDVGEATLLAGGDDARITEKVRARAQRLDLAKTNKLIVTHNKYYPMEANLPMDMQTGAFLLLGQPWQPEPLVTVERLVEETVQALAARRGQPDQDQGK